MEAAMVGREHRYCVRLEWVGNRGRLGRSFKNHDRSYVLEAAGKPAIAGSSDKVFRGDTARWSPEDLLVASLSACHKLWYMGLCAAAGIEVLAYEDEAEGTMVEVERDGPGQFTQVVLRPRVTLAPGSDRGLAEELHHAAHDKCFVARSVNFPVTHVPVTTVTAG
jgi:organic hydroperoxide reductase OsmC/OhrA